MKFIPRITLFVFIFVVIPVLGTKRLGDRAKDEVWVRKPAVGAGLAAHDNRRLDEDDYYFLVSQASDSQDWCIIAPELDWPYEPSYHEGILGFGQCEPYWDGYPSEGSLQLFRLDDDGKMHSGEYPDLCMIVNNGVNIGGGLVRLDDCAINSNLNKFTYDSNTKNIKLVPPNDEYCLTNEGSTTDLDDTIHAKLCGTRGRYKFEFHPARYYWQIIANGCGVACMMAEDGDAPSPTDKVYIDHCGSPGDGWRFEETSTDAVRFRNKLDDAMCMQAGQGDPPMDGTKLRFYPCDENNDLQLFVREFSTGSDSYLYKILPLVNDNLCVVHQGATCEIGDEIILKECSNAVSDIDGWYDDEA